MKASPLLQLVCIAVLTFQTLTTHAAPPMDMGATNDFSAVGNAVVDLLKSHDVTRFVIEMAPTTNDFGAVIRANSMFGDQTPSYANAARRTLKASADAFLQMADSLHLNFSDSNFVARVIPPKYPGRIYFNGDPRDTKQGTPYVSKLDIVLASNTNATDSPGGDFKITVNGLVQFPGGWKPDGGIQWAAFPSGVADERTQREMTILQLASEYKGLRAQDDPALLQLANAVVQFIRERDVHIYESQALAGADEMFSLAKKQQEKMTRKDFDGYWDSQQQDWLKSAGTVLQFMDDAGVDFKSAQIQVRDASIKNLQPRMVTGTAEGLSGDQFKIQLTVQSGDKSKNGTSLAGNYTLAADEITRLGDDWKITGNLRWDEMPAGVLDAQTEAKMQFESYVAQHGTLPPGTAAPDIEFTRLDNGEKLKSSDLHGKVVVLDFWATWCGPCQAPMARLQKMHAQYPDWKDKVTIVPLSIDDTIQIVRNHVDKRGWTNTFNVWAGDGGWGSAPAKTFHVRGVPTTYIIDPQGKIVIAGHPDAINIDDEVNGQLSLAKQ